MSIENKTDSCPEFIITEHASKKIKNRFRCHPNKIYKIMLKAWKTKETPGYVFINKANQYYENRIYKMFNGYVFVFHVNHNKLLNIKQKYLITVFKRKGFQFHT